jgi:hypothetical protein
MKKHLTEVILRCAAQQEIESSVRLRGCRQQDLRYSFRSLARHHPRTWDRAAACGFRTALKCRGVRAWSSGAAASESSASGPAFYDLRCPSSERGFATSHVVNDRTLRAARAGVVLSNGARHDWVSTDAGWAWPTCGLLSCRWCGFYEDLGLTSVVTTQRCSDLATPVNPSFSYVDSAPLFRNPADTESAFSGYPSTVPPPKAAIRSSAPARAAAATPCRRCPLPT